MARMLGRATIVAATVAALLPSGLARAAAPPDDLQAGLSAIVAAGMPGAFAQARDARTTRSAAAGVADVTTGQPTRSWFMHRVGSITKTFTATALLQLVGEGRLALDAPLGDYLPDFVVPGVTVRMLLNHTSGIGDYDTIIFATPEALEANRYRTFAPAELIQLGIAAPRTNEPGALWSYSNTNYLLAGMILEKITGRPAWLEISLRILWPLGLWQSYFPGPTTKIVGPHAGAYIPWYDGTLRDFSTYNMSWAWTAGELISTAADLNTFYRALLSGKLLKPAQLAQMKTVVPYDPANPQYGGYGLGLYSTALPCGIVWGHDGAVWGQTAISWHTADGQRQVTVGLNMAQYAAPGTPDPILAATVAMMVTQLCGSDAPGTTAPRGATVGPHLVDTGLRP